MLCRSGLAVVGLCHRRARLGRGGCSSLGSGGGWRWGLARGGADGLGRLQLGGDGAKASFVVGVGHYGRGLEGVGVGDEEWWHTAGVKVQQERSGGAW